METEVQKPPIRQPPKTAQEKINRRKQSAKRIIINEKSEHPARASSANPDKKKQVFFITTPPIQKDNKVQKLLQMEPGIEESK